MPSHNVGDGVVARARALSPLVHHVIRPDRDVRCTEGDRQVGRFIDDDSPRRPGTAVVADRLRLGDVARIERGHVHCPRAPWYVEGRTRTRAPSRRASPMARALPCSTWRSAVGNHRASAPQARSKSPGTAEPLSRHGLESPRSNYADQVRHGTAHVRRERDRRRHPNWVIDRSAEAATHSTVGSRRSAAAGSAEVPYQPTV